MGARADGAEGMEEEVVATWPGGGAAVRFSPDTADAAAAHCLGFVVSVVVDRQLRHAQMGRQVDLGFVHVGKETVTGCFSQGREFKLKKAMSDILTSYIAHYMHVDVVETLNWFHYT
jgi:hypothetical protein